MKITVIGAGEMGSAIVKQLNTAGHLIRVTCKSSGRAKLLEQRHTAVRAVAPNGAANGADVVIVATRFIDAIDALNAVGDLKGMTVVDVTNPLTADYKSLTVGRKTSAAEQISMAFEGAKVVKAFNTVLASVLADGGELGNGQRVNVFLASDSQEAKQTVRRLVASMGSTAIDTGGLTNARHLETLAALNLYMSRCVGLGVSARTSWAYRA